MVVTTRSGKMNTDPPMPIVVNDMTEPEMIDVKKVDESKEQFINENLIIKLCLVVEKKIVASKGKKKEFLKILTSIPRPHLPLS